MLMEPGKKGLCPCNTICMHNLHAQDAANTAMFGPDSVIGTACRAFVITHYLPLSFAVALTIALAWPAPGIAALHVTVSALAAAASSSSSSHWLLQLSRQGKSGCGSSSRLTTSPFIIVNVACHPVQVAC